MIRRSLPFIPGLVLLTLWAYAACSDPGTEPDAPRPTTISLTPHTAELSALEETVQLSAQVRDQNGQTMTSVSVSWSSDTPGVATVNGSGLVTSVSNGGATVTATAATASAATIVVVDQVATTIVVSPAADTVVETDTLRLAAAATDRNGHPVDGIGYAWVSNNPEVVTVDPSGLVTGRAAGEVRVSATSSGVTGSAALRVVAPRPTTAAVVPDTIEFSALGQEVLATVEVYDQAGRAITGVAASWSSGDTAVVAVDSTGLVTARAQGETTLVAAVGNASGEALARVVQSVRSVSVSPVFARLGPGDTLRVAAEAFDANGYPVKGARVGWATSDSAVALVDSVGLVTGAGEGQATIRASRDGATAGSTIVVENPDRAALVALYEATGGPSWTNDDNWVSDAPLSDWRGVTVDEWGRVYFLNLSDNGLTGSIPPEVGDLTALERLFLQGNALSGEIAPELGNLARLRRLSLEWNELAGRVPPELSNLSNLGHLGLGANELVGPVPPELGNLKNLGELSLHNTRLAGPIPVELLKLTSLGYVNFHATELCLPGTGDFWRWREQISVFDGEAYCNDVDRSVLSAFYEAAGGPGWERSEGWAKGSPALSEWHGVTADSLGRVQSLALGANNLAGRIPSVWWGGLSELRILDLADNPLLQGPLPLSLIHTSLDILRIRGTGICILPGSREWLVSIPALDGAGGVCAALSDRQILETLYEATDGSNWQDNTNWMSEAPLGDWHGVKVNGVGQVQSLFLSRNDLTGSIPPEPRRYHHISLCHNRLA